MGVKKMLFVGIAALSLVAYGLDSEDMSTLDRIDAEYQELLQKEAEKVEEFRVEKAKLEEELVALKERQIGKEEVFEKLKRDSEIRWHRDEYKKLLKKYEEYYVKLEKAIQDKETQISELERLLQIIG